MLDYMVTEYCRLRNDCRLAIVYPCAVKRVGLIESILAERCEIVCRKKIPVFGRYAPNNIIRQVYPGASWMERAKNGFKLGNKKAELCFAGPRYLYAILLQAPSSVNLIEVKEKVREKIGLGNDSLHTSDNHTETVSLTRMFFNTNSVYFLTMRRLSTRPFFTND